MKTWWWVVCGVGLAFPASLPAQRFEDRLAALIAADSDSVDRRGLIDVYEPRGYRPLWIADDVVRPGAERVLAALTQADMDGLDPRRYAWHPPAAGADSIARVELGLTELLIRYVEDVSGGRVRPGPTDTIWSASSLPNMLRDAGRALDSLPPDTVVRRLSPPQPGYVRLRSALARYRAIAVRGGWASLRDGPDLTPGTHGVRVRELRRRLALESDTAPRDTAGDAYDQELTAAVRRFQKNHGLDVDGVTGDATRAALNVPAADRVRQIELNLERWRWLPRRLGNRYIMVNSAAFALALVDHDSVVLSMRAIVGRLDWPTPIVSSRLKQLIFSPAWEIPKKIVLAEIVPLVVADTGYLTREHIIVHDWAKGGRPVNAHEIDWRALTDSSYTLHLTQAPGETNPLGGVKFEFGNRFATYIHDTPFRALFRQRVRTFSHGCVRAERAAALARAVLADSLRWPLDSVRTAMRGDQPRVVTLDNSVPVYLTYWTAWVERDGEVQFREDLYGWDQMLARLVADK
ncbi:MAG TPA: L,D-transpeptidase family protein [Gemmatimonadales bacterium]|nr:L,D-transpeptidase family protein [Gemmatimonadales bacterium]